MHLQRRDFGVKTELNAVLSRAVGKRHAKLMRVADFVVLIVDGAAQAGLQLAPAPVRARQSRSARAVEKSNQQTTSCSPRRQRARTRRDPERSPDFPAPRARTRCGPACRSDCMTCERVHRQAQIAAMIALEGSGCRIAQKRHSPARRVPATYADRSCKAASERPSEPSSTRHAPGAFHGSHMPGVSMPPLAKLVSRPGPCARSITVTSCPRRLRKYAVVTPIRPLPITTILRHQPQTSLNTRKAFSPRMPRICSSL